MVAGTLLFWLLRHPTRSKIVDRRGLRRSDANTRECQRPGSIRERRRLRNVSDAKPGIVRKRSGKGFRYVDADGKTVKDPETLARIKSLVIPPAWTNI